MVANRQRISVNSEGEERRDQERERERGGEKITRIDILLFIYIQHACVLCLPRGKEVRWETEN